MANGVVVQFAVLLALAVVLTCLLIVYNRRKARLEPSHKVPQMRAVVEKSEKIHRPIQGGASQQPPQSERPVPRTITMETDRAIAVADGAVNAAANSAAPQPTVVPGAQPLTIKEDRNQEILSVISKNIQKSLIKPVPTYSPIDYPEPPRETEYVRVKKKIITPHGQIRFSILKDSLSINMLAVFRRASLDWKTPDDLIGFLPAYLEPEAEILNGQVLLVGTPGHPEKLAIPIRSVDPESTFRDYFDFVTDTRTANNTPAVLQFSDTEFELVSKGVIAQPAFMNRSERVHSEVKFLERDPADMKLLAEKSRGALQTN